MNLTAHHFFVFNLSCLYCSLSCHCASPDLCISVDTLQNVSL